jgi:membrane fusion protein, copper/silver efflux system
VSDETPSTTPAPETPHVRAEPPRSRLVYALDIVLVRLRFIGLLIAVMLLAAYWDDMESHVERWFRPAAAAGPAGQSDIEYFCPMHPHVVRPEPGNCPICGMPLSKRKRGETVKLPEGVLTRVQFTPFRIAQGGIRTSPVEWKPLEREISTVGFVDYDERRLARITARFPGRVESLAVDFTGTRVEKGRPLATLYSPEVFAAEESLLAAVRGLAEARSAARPDERAVARSSELADAARSRLALWGLLPEQLEAIEKAGKSSPTVEVLAPLAGVVTRKSVVAGDYVAEGAALFDVADLSTVWIKARVYEDDLGIVAVGQKVTATASAYPGETFEGTVVFVDPFLDKATRTADLRIDLANEGGRLKPGMYVTAAVRVRFADVEPFRSMPRPAEGGKARVVYWCPMHPSHVQDAPGKCDECDGMDLQRKEVPAAGPDDVPALPETAVVDTGKRKVVYVESSEGVFDAREVVLGPRAGAFYPVVRGVEPGMRVATAGSFLIDAETRLNPAAAGSYFGASGTEKKPAAHEGHGR